MRQRARTDLHFLATRILGYKDIDLAIHGPILDSLQQFQGGSEILDDKGNWRDYKPACSLWELSGSRDNLILDPRGFLKTTIVSISHSVQWIINYPDVRVHLGAGISEQAERVLKETLGHFRYNGTFRWLFPEFCPQRSVKDFGSNEEFTVPCRKQKWLKEPTVSMSSVGKAISGSHYDVIKCADLVDKENVKTPHQIREVKEHFWYMEPLLQRSDIWPHRGWRDVEGTRYDFNDLYGDIIERMEEGRIRGWKMHVRGAVNDDGSPLWPSRFPLTELDRIRREDGEYIYSTQYLNKPIPQGSGLATQDQIKFVARKTVREILPFLRMHATIDLGGMQPTETGDFSAFSVGGFDRDGRCLIVDGFAGHFSPFEVIELIFEMHERYGNKLIDIKMEEEAHTRILLPFLKREMSKRGKYPMIVPIRRDTRISKKHRIKGLQPWFQAGIIRFADDLAYKLELIHEITRFSDTSTYHDDILDTLADQMQNREGGITGDVMPDSPDWDGKPLPARAPKFLGFGAAGEPVWDEGMFRHPDADRDGVYVGL